MADRNDELLLKLGWTYEPKHRAYAWKGPNSERVRTPKRPRPFDSVDDGLAICRERGWAIEAHLFDPEIGNLIVLSDCLEDGTLPLSEAKADTPAEALSLAIMKAIGKTDD